MYLGQLYPIGNRFCKAILIDFQPYYCQSQDEDRIHGRLKQGQDSLFQLSQAQFSRRLMCHLTSDRLYRVKWCSIWLRSAKALPYQHFVKMRFRLHSVYGSKQNKIHQDQIFRRKSCSLVFGPLRDTNAHVPNFYQLHRFLFQFHQR